MQVSVTHKLSVTHRVIDEIGYTEMPGSPCHILRVARHCIQSEFQRFLNQYWASSEERKSEKEGWRRTSRRTKRSPRSRVEPSQRDATYFSGRIVFSVSRSM